MSEQIEKKSWIVLIKEWIGNQLIYTLANFGFILMEFLVTGTVDNLSLTFFYMGQWGAFSVCWIAIIKEKWGYMSGERLKNALPVADDITDLSETSILGKKDAQFQDLSAFKVIDSGGNAYNEIAEDVSTTTATETMQQSKISFTTEEVDNAKE